jgi:5'-methylthioadenosine phosphorylase
MSSSGSRLTETPHSNLPDLSFAIIGGSGLCTLPEGSVETGHIRPSTPYGEPSDDLVIAEYKGQPFVFLPRHGSNHSLPPHRIPYKANIAALKQLGVRYAIGMSIGGSLRQEIKPGHVVVPDQFVNLTWGRDDHFETDRSFVHLPMADPYCDRLRATVGNALCDAGAVVHSTGTVAVIQGPRFSTRAESQWFMANGWDVVNMTQYPECYFARELGICYAAAIAITDYDVGIPGLNIDPANIDKVLEIFRSNVRMLKDAALAIAAAASQTIHCACAAKATLPYYN